MKYQAFLSYSHEDRKWAHWLHRALESYRPPPELQSAHKGRIPRSLAPIFRDRDELPSSADLSSAVQDALCQSEWLIVVCSPNAVASRWVNEEIRYFRQLGRSERVLCFIIEGEPDVQAPNNCLPNALMEADFAGDSLLEPLAADARRLGDGRRKAMLKIAAGMLGVGLDELWQREIRRHHKRLVAATVGSITVALVMVLLALTAMIARDEAEQRRVQAEDLIDFMLGDLHEQLRQIGRLDVFESVDEKALEYFKQQHEDGDSENMLSLRARNLRQIGEVRMELGNLDGAHEAFTESLWYVQQRVQLRPGNLQAQIDLANSLFYVGYVHWMRSELVQAGRIFEQVVDIVDGVVEEEPDNPSWLIERAYAYTNLGRVMELQGALGEALSIYEKVMQANQRLVSLEPDNDEWVLELGFAHNNLGKLSVGLGRLDEAVAHFRKDLEIKDALYAADTKNNNLRAYLGVSQFFLGELLADRGVFNESNSLLSEARDHFVFLTEFAPERIRWQVRLGNIERVRGRLLWLSGRRAEGMSSLENANQILTRVSANDPENAGLFRDLVQSLLVTGDFELRQGIETEAANSLDTALNYLERLQSMASSGQEKSRLSVYAAICTARLNEVESTREKLDSALSVLDEYYPDTLDPHIVELRAAALGLLGREIEASQLRSELQIAGYRGLDLANSGHHVRGDS